MRIAIKPMPQGGAVSWFRGTGPGAFVAERGHQVAYLHSALLPADAQRELVRTADVVHVVGAAGELPAEFRERRGALSVDLDDDLWAWGDDPVAAAAEDAKQGQNAGKKVTGDRLAQLEAWLAEADVVTTTTRALAGVIGRHVPGAYIDVVPNALDEGVQAKRRADSAVLRKAGLAKDDARVIAWTGSVAHIPDLTPVLEGLARVGSVDGAVEVRSLGPVDFLDSPGFKSVFGRAHASRYRQVVVNVAGVRMLIAPFEVYYQTLAAMQPTAAVVPMRASPFNAGKSAVTLYSWGIQSVPCVCSRFGPYAEAEREGFPARYVEHEDVGAWTDALRDLLYDPIGARALGERAQAWVLERRTFPKAAEAWERAWGGAFERRRSVADVIKATERS